MRCWQRIFWALRSEQGSAMPVALMVLVVLTPVVAGFTNMSATEPSISTNLKAGHEALALAEAAQERIIWALDHVGAPGAGAVPPAVAPYNGTQLVASGQGAYQMLVIPQGDPAWAALNCAAPGGLNDLCAQTWGFVPRPGTVLPAAPPVPQANLAGRRRLVSLLTKVRDLDPPCVICVNGSAEIKGNASVDARTSTCSSDKKAIGVTEGTVNPMGAVSLWAQGDNVPNQADDSMTMTKEEFKKEATFTQDELNILKSMAQAVGNYVKPTSNDQFKLDLKDGLTFVDTVDGAPIGSPVDPTKLADVKISGADKTGWLVVMGDLTIDGNVTYRGLVYVMNDIIYTGTGPGYIDGAIISENVYGDAQTVIDASKLAGNARIRYNCDYVKDGGGWLPRGYFLKAGTWRELPD